MTTDELIAALEKATGPAYVLDEAISIWRYTEAGEPPPANPRPYTASLDAAMTLVPEGAGVEMRRYWLTTSIMDAIDVALDGPERGRVWSALVVWGVGDESAASEDCPTPALALCIAALRARAALAAYREAGQ